MDNIFLQLAIVLLISSILGYVIYKLKLPLTVAYILAGVFLSFVSFFDPNSSLVLNILPEIGVAFVLFLIGMELNLREIRALGKPIIVAAFGQILITAIVGSSIARALGFQPLESILIGFGLAFSSTVVVIKMLLEKKGLTSLYGKLSVGILLAGNLIAVTLLMTVSVETSFFKLGFQESAPLVTIVLKAISLFVLTFIVSRFVLEKVFDAVAKSVELLFFTAITWCFAFAYLSIILGFSAEIGAFLAGVALASSPYHIQIQGKVKPIRDFLLVLFFVFLGAQVKIIDLFSAWQIILVFTLFVLFVKPFLYMLLLGIFGFKKHTLFQTSINLSQVSEFSLKILVVGVAKDLVSPLAFSVMVAIAILSMIPSTIGISYSEKLYKLFAPFLNFFEHKSKVHFFESRLNTLLENHIIIIGAHRVGGPVVDYLREAKIPFLVVDFNPHTVGDLREKGVNVIYGDVSDPEVLDHLQMEKAKLIISTVSHFPDNELLIEECRRRESKAKIVIRTEDKDQALKLKTLGADYIISPEKVSGVYLVNQIKHYWPKPQFLGLD